MLHYCRFERQKIQMVEARQQAVYDAEGRLVELEQSMCAEGNRMKAAAQELDNP